jgi:hypothetical protein
MRLASEPATAARQRQVVFWGTWLTASLFFGWRLSRGSQDFSSGLLLNLAVLLLCTLALLWRTPSPVHDGPSEPLTRKGPLSLLILLAVVVLFPLRTLIGPGLLFALPVVAIGVLVLLRQPVIRGELAYALVLAMVAGLAGLGAGWINEFRPQVWAGLQVLLVVTGLLAGWAMLRYTALAEQGVGKSLVLSAGVGRGVVGFLLGILIAVPWALANIVMGGSAGDNWVRAMWQPFLAIQPAIAEEAWGRLLLVPLLFLLFRRAARPRTALTAALILMSYWFAYLHTPGGLGAMPSTLLIGTLYALPVSYLCLYRDLETAIGWHFWVDFIRFAFALMLVGR